MNKLSSQLQLIATGKVKALLYDLGEYPGAVKSGETQIAGDVFAIVDGSVLALLDDYEGDEYDRQKTMVDLSSGETIEAWIYWYKGELAGRQPLSGGDYIAYLKNQKRQITINGALRNETDAQSLAPGK